MTIFQDHLSGWWLEFEAFQCLVIFYLLLIIIIITILYPFSPSLYLTKILLILQEETKQKQNLNWVKKKLLSLFLYD